MERRREIDVAIQLPTGSPITARARLVSGLRNAPAGSIRFASEYWLARPTEKERFRRYWLEAQRRARRLQMSQRRVAVVSRSRRSSPVPRGGPSSASITAASIMAASIMAANGAKWPRTRQKRRMGTSRETL